MAELCGHKSSIVKRGLCARCYQTVVRMVQSGKCTWDEAEEAKIIGPKQSGPTNVSEYRKGAEKAIQKIRSGAKK